MKLKYENQVLSDSVKDLNKSITNQNQIKDKEMQGVRETLAEKQALIVKLQQELKKRLKDTDRVFFICRETSGGNKTRD